MNLKELSKFNQWCNDYFGNINISEEALEAAWQAATEAKQGRITELESILNAICGVLGVEHYGSAKAAIGALQQEVANYKERIGDLETLLSEFRDGTEYKRATDMIGKLRKALESGIALCEKFVNKVETGRARSRETYADSREFLRIAQQALKK